MALSGKQIAGLVVGGLATVGFVMIVAAKLSGGKAARSSRKGGGGSTGGGSSGGGGGASGGAVAASHGALHRAVVGFVVSIGIALAITAATLPGRRTAAAIDALAKTSANLEDAALGGDRSRPK